MTNPATPNLYRMFSDRAQRFPDRKQFWHRTGSGWTPHSLQEVHQKVLRLATKFRALGVKSGDRLGLWAENSLHWVIADQAAYALGAVVVPVYPTSTPEEAKFIFQDSGVRLVCSAGESRIRSLLAMGQGLVSGVVSFERHQSDRVTSALEVYENSAVEAGVDAPGLGQSAGSLATVIYTSGTTGRPKGVQLSHGNILANVDSCLDAFPLGENDRCLSFLPLSHTFERTCGYYVMLSAGVGIHYAESIDTVPRDLKETAPTVVISVPRLYEKVYARIKAAAGEGSWVKRRITEFAFRVADRVAEAWAGTPHEGLSRRGERGPVLPPGLRLKAWLASALVFRKVQGRVGGRLRWFISGGAPLSPEIARFFYGVGIPIQEGYGLTETSPVIAANRPGEIRFGTVGRPLKGLEVRIAEDGEILCRGVSVMGGYLNLPEESAEALKDGWFHTGDIGELDAHGFLKITDRKKSLLVLSNGKKVAPQEIETCLKSDPLIAQVVPWGDNRPYVTALVVPDIAKLAGLLGLQAPQTPAERETLCSNPAATDLMLARIEKLMQTLAPFKHVRKIRLHPHELTLDGGELTPTMKVKMRVIKERHGPALEALYSAGPKS